jgi:hypothetical protein
MNALLKANEASSTFKKSQPRSKNRLDGHATYRDLRDALQRHCGHLLMKASSPSSASQAMRPDDLMPHMVDGGFISAATSHGYRDDLCSLDDVLERIDRSNSWAYENGVVPMFDRVGREIKSAKIPSWPWEMLPTPIIKVGKKAWLSSSIDFWIRRMELRVNQREDASGSPMTSEGCSND